MSTTATGSTTFADASRTIIVDEDEEQRLLDAIDDAGCRTILEVTGDEAMSANELSEACDLPLSTTYRKLELLTESGLLAESIRIRRSGKHTSEYARCVDDVHLAVGADGGFEVTLERRVPATAQ